MLNKYLLRNIFHYVLLVSKVMDLESGFMGFSSQLFIYDSSEANIYSNSI